MGGSPQPQTEVASTTTVLRRTSRGASASARAPITASPRSRQRRSRFPFGAGISLLVSCAAHAVLLVALACLLLPAKQTTRGSRMELHAVEVVQPQLAATLPPPAAAVEISSIRGGDGPRNTSEAEVARVPVPRPTIQRPLGTGQGGAFGKARGHLAGGGSLWQPIHIGNRGAEFFGISAQGSRFVFVVYSSGSMMLGDRWRMACEELLAAVSRLGQERSFYVVFFDARPHPMFEPVESAEEMLPASDENIRRLQRWIGGRQFGLATKPLGAVRKAISLKPDAIYLLSDGEFQDATALYLRRRKKSAKRDASPPVVINTIGLDTVKGRDVLRRIAEENGGEYRLIPGR